MDIRHKTIVITGAGRGIGRAIAQQLAERGADLALFDLNEADLEETRSLCAAESVQARQYKVNVADEAEVSGAMRQVSTDFGRLDGLVNNAGIVRDGLLVKVKDGAVVGRMSMEQWNAVIAVNLSGMASEDVDYLENDVLAGDLANFSHLVDRLHQGFVNELLAMRMMAQDRAGS